MQPLSNFSNLTDSHICLERLFSNAHKFYHVIMSPFGREKHFVQQPILATLVKYEQQWWPATGGLGGFVAKKTPDKWIFSGTNCNCP